MLKLSENLFIGAQELNMLQNFNNFTTIMGLMTKNFGFLENQDLNNLLQKKNKERKSFQLIVENNKLKFPTPSYAFAYPNKLITWDIDRFITLDDSFKNNGWWVKISYDESYIEKGIVTIDKDGNVHGSNTFFTEKLRGEPGFPSRITLFLYENNEFVEKETYYVDTVLSNTDLKVYSPNGIGDITKTYYYAVRGTFPPNVDIFGGQYGDEFPFRYDSCKVEFVAGSNDNIPNEYYMRNSNTEFYVGWFSVDGEGNIGGNQGVAGIQDKRFIFEENNTPDSEYIIEENNRYSKWYSSK